MSKRLDVKPDLPYANVILLAALTIPRVPIHDLKLISFESPIYKILAIVPFLVWLAVAVFRRTTRPIYDFLAIGITYGVFLGAIHQILWEASWGNNTPKLGGNLAGIDPSIENIIIRIVGFCSSILTGLLIGLVFGFIALVARSVREKLKKT